MLCDPDYLSAMQHVSSLSGTHLKSAITVLLTTGEYAQ